jgi:hypothetical protein
MRKRWILRRLVTGRWQIVQATDRNFRSSDNFGERQNTTRAICNNLQAIADHEKDFLEMAAAAHAKILVEEPGGGMPRAADQAGIRSL